MHEFNTYINQAKNFVNKFLSDYLPERYPEELYKAMRYSLLNSGKRIRPILLMATDSVLRYPKHNQMIFDSSLFNKNILILATALECIHTYSLIHDDLPAMDDDILRRGYPTLHVKYNEATAILAGDALLTHAFYLISQIETDKIIKLKKIIFEITTAAGPEGMIGGQYIDIISEGKKIEQNSLEYIHNNKTMKLIRLPIILAGLLNETEKLEILKEYGSILGLLFQITDDILNIKGNIEEMGKPSGTDSERCKTTYPALFGIEKSEEIASLYKDKAIKIIRDFDQGRSILSFLPEYLLNRKK